MYAKLLFRLWYWFNYLKYLNVPRSPVGPIALSGAGLPTDLGIELLNDDSTPMVFVVRVLEECFWMNHDAAFRAMATVHKDGPAFLGYLEREKAERLVDHVVQMSRGRGFPLAFRLQPVGGVQGASGVSA